MNRISKYIRKENNGCWTWTGCVNSNLIPVARIDGKTKSVKRALYCHDRGITGTGRLKIYNTCSNKDCINPSHMAEIQIYYLNVDDKDFLKEVESKCQKDSKKGCWIWPSKNLIFYYDNKKRNLLSAIYRVVNENKTNTCKLIHTCHNQYCCNPEHIKERRLYPRDIPIKIESKQYANLSEAEKATGVPRQTLKKHLVKSVFDIGTYRNNCIRRRKKPKI